MQDVRFGFQAAAVRFAEEICPRYSSAMRKGRAA
jgi:hypothetical protein